MKILIIALFLLPVLVNANEDIETSIGLYTSGVTDGYTDSAGVALVTSIFYTKYQIDIGAEMLTESTTDGVFISGRHPINHEWNVGAGIGILGYNVDTSLGDYYAKPSALMLFSDYQTKYGKIVTRLILSESDKNYYTAECTHTSAPPDNHLDSCLGSKTNINNSRQMIMIGYQYDF